MSYSVYCHTTPSNKKYVGISNSPEKRWNYGKGYKDNWHFFRAINKYGWENISHEILYEGLTEEEARSIESKLIKEWKLTDRMYGYNLREGDNGFHCAESRVKMSISQRGNKNSVGRRLSNETKSKISESLKDYYKVHTPTMLGRRHTEETIGKLRQKTVSNETRQKMRENHADVRGAKNPSARAIIQYSLNGEEIEIFPYASLAAQKYNLDLSSIISCCRGKAKSCGGFKWEYVSSDMNVYNQIEN